MYKKILTIDDVLAEVRKNHKISDTNLIKKAYDYASEMHKDVYRKSGEPYIMHPLRVAMQIAKWGFESDSVAAALLHDVIEDCKKRGASDKIIEDNFGSSVYRMVNAVTSLDETEHPELSKEQLDMLSDIRLQKEMTIKAVFIKAADRIDNMETLDAMPETKQYKKSIHTRQIIIPMLREVGAFDIIDQLDELCFMVENKSIYNEIQKRCTDIRKENHDSHKMTLELFKECFVNLDSRHQKSLGTKSVSKRIKELKCTPRRIVSIYRDITRMSSDTQNSSLDYINKHNISLFDFTLIVDDSLKVKGSSITPEDLFMSYYVNVLSKEGLCATSIKNTTQGNSSYILLSDSRENMYRLFILTETEYRRYCYGRIIDEDGTLVFNDIDENDPNETYNQKIIVFMKDGTKTTIDAGSSVLDFAFHIHTEIGLHFKYALIDGQKMMYGPGQKISEGQKITIVHDVDVEPSIRWFKYLRTRNAREKLVRHFEGKR